MLPLDVAAACRTVQLCFELQVIPNHSGVRVSLTQDIEERHRKFVNGCHERDKSLSTCFISQN